MRVEKKHVPTHQPPSPGIPATLQPVDLDDATSFDMSDIAEVEWDFAASDIADGDGNSGAGSVNGFDSDIDALDLLDPSNDETEVYDSE